MQVAKWNYDRGNTNFDKELETRMLAEEAQEFKDGMTMWFTAISDSGKLDALVELIDAWADYQFVMQGTIYKYLGSLIPFDFDLIRTQEHYMYDTLTTTLKLPKDMLEEALGAVITANNAKGTEKIDGKIQKGSDWKDPKESIRNLLEDCYEL